MLNALQALRTPVGGHQKMRCVAYFTFLFKKKKKKKADFKLTGR